MSLLNKASLIQIPSGYKDGTLYSAKPTNGDGDFTFSRGSNLAATRVNSEGLIEKGRENLLLQSNSFDTTWSGVNATLTSGQSGYDGTNNAWEFEATNTSANTRVDQSISSSGVHTFSIYAKAGTTDWVRINILLTGVGNANNYYDVSNGVKGSSPSSSLIADKIESVGNGWYRISMLTEALISEVRVQVATNDGDASVTSGDNIIIQDAQLELGLVSTDVITTTTTTEQAGILEDMPRLDYSGGASCPSLLLEPQRTNGIPNSEYFSGWTAINNVSLTENNTTSPEGKTNASLMSVSGAGSLARGIRIGSQSTSTDKKTMSVFAKANTADTIQLYHSGEVQGYVNFDLSSGEVGTSGTNGTGDIEPMGNDWYRCVATFNSVGNFGSSIYVGFATSSSAPYGGGSISDTSLSVYIYGAQYEIGSYATSYIPTYGSGSSVTRGADDCESTSVSSIIGQTEGTLLTQVGDFPQEVNGRIFAISDGSSNNYITIIKSGSNNDFGVYVNDGGVTQVAYTGSASLTGDDKIGVAYANNDYVIYVNGTQVHTDTSASVPACSAIWIGQRENGSKTYIAGGSVKQALLFKTKLSNDELATLTT